MKLLISNPADANAISRQGTPLLEAVKNSRAACVSQLLKMGARPDERCYHAAERKGNQKVIRLLAAYPPMPDEPNVPIIAREAGA